MSSHASTTGIIDGEGIGMLSSREMGVVNGSGGRDIFKEVIFSNGGRKGGSGLRRSMTTLFRIKWNGRGSGE